MNGLQRVTLPTLGVEPIAFDPAAWEQLPAEILNAIGEHVGNVGGVLDLICHKIGGSNGTALDWLRQEFGIDMDERREVATFDYRDERGEVLYQVVRSEPKKFRQRRPDGKGGWTWKVKGVRRVPYRLFELEVLATHETVLIVEGEKHVDRLADLGFVATCNVGGAGSWTKDLNEHFTGKTAYILPDNDEVGREHAEKVARNLQGIAYSVRVVELPDLPPKGDVIDWLDQGGDPTTLLDICQSFPEWVPSAEPSPNDLKILKPTDWQGLVVPKRRWVVDGLIPLGNVTMVSGDGGAGKSQLAMQLLASTALGKSGLAHQHYDARRLAYFVRMMLTNCTVACFRFASI